MSTIDTLGDGSEMQESARKSGFLRPTLDLRRWAAVLVTALIVWIAFALRVYRIDGQSLWYDEGVSAVMAQRDLASIAVNAAADIHPPLYYYFLHFWASLAGGSEFALRWLSLMFGVMLVALVFKLGQRLFDSQVGYAAAFFTAVAPFTIYYSQEARMYMQVAFLGALSTCLFLPIQSIFETGIGGRLRKRTLVAYIFASIALLYSHYFSFSILAFHNLWMLMRFVGTRKPLSDRLGPAALWIGVQLIVVAAFGPWLMLSLAQVGGWPSISEPFDLGTLLYNVFRVFTFGLSWDAAATPRKEQLFLLLLTGSMLALLLRRGEPSFPSFAPDTRPRPPTASASGHFVRHFASSLALVLAISYFLIPVLTMYLLSLQRPMYNPKFLLLATPGYYLLLAVGLVSLGRFVSTSVPFVRSLPAMARYACGALVVAALLSGAGVSMSKSTLAYYSDPKYARDDYRGLARFIESQAEANDAIILNAPGQMEIFRYYFRGEQAVYPLPGERPMDKQRTEVALRDIIGGHKRIWLVLWAQAESDPEGFVERWLDENGFKASNDWFGGVRLVQYVVGRGAVSWQAKINATFGQSIRLDEIHLGSTLAKPGDILDIALYWQAMKPVDERYTVFLHIIDSQEYLWGQRDSEPSGGNRMTTSWADGETIEDRHGVPVLPGTPPGRYQFEIGLYEQKTGRRLPITSEDGGAIGDRLLFGQLEVAKATSPVRAESLTIQHRTSTTFGENLRLLGFDFHKLGQPTSSIDFRSGDLSLTTLYWQATEAIPQDYLVDIEIVGKDGVVMLSDRAQPGAGKYPTSRWSAGEFVRDQRRLSLAYLEPGEYSLRLRLLDRSTGNPVVVKGDGAVSNGMAEVLKFHVR